MSGFRYYRVPKSPRDLILACGLTGVFNGRRLGFARTATADTPIRYTDLLAEVSVCREIPSSS
jgi:hypothetical protein